MFGLSQYYMFHLHMILFESSIISSGSLRMRGIATHCGLFNKTSRPAGQRHHQPWIYTLSVYGDGLL